MRSSRQTTAKNILLYSAALVAIAGSLARAASASGGVGEDPLPRALIGIVVILLAAKIGADLVARLGQPAVLGELLFGIILGNLFLVGINCCNFVKTDQAIKLLSEIGVVILLFQVGLESNLAKLMQVGLSSLLVAVTGVIVPFFLGWWVAAIFLPADSVYVHVFLGATLCATSVGITARVMRDLGRLHSREANVILGAAIIDDVLGLVILAAVAGVITAANSGASLSSLGLLYIVGEAAVFLVAAIVIGRWLSPKLFRVASRLRAADLLLTGSLAICFGLAFMAKQAGLAPIVGAFAAGLILDEVKWSDYRENETHSIEELVAPIAALLVPIFFVRMGAEVDLRTFANPSVLLFAGALSVAAILSKQICGLGIAQRGIDRLSVGIGMIPRGEVGLIFASVGSTLTFDGRSIVAPNAFAAVVVMVIVTTVMTPPLVKWSLSRSERRSQRDTSGPSPQ